MSPYSFDAIMTLSGDDLRRLEYLIQSNRQQALSIGEGDELRMLLSLEDANASWLEWPDLVKLGEALVSNRGFVT